MMFSPWENWGLCSELCDSEEAPARHKRTRKCLDPDGNCLGPLEDFKKCDVDPCPSKLSKNCVDLKYALKKLEI